MKLLPRIMFEAPVHQLRYEILRSKVDLAWIRVQLAWNRFKEFIYS